MIDIRKYIESGILEEYVAGTLTSQERAEVEELIETHPELAQEIESISISLSVFTEIGAVEPASYMEERIWDSIIGTDFDGEEETVDKSLLTSNKATKLPYILTVAMSIIILVITYLLIESSNDLEVAKVKIIELENKNNELIKEYDRLKKDYDSLNTISNIYNLENSKIIVMNSNKRNAGNSIVLFIWNKDNSKIYLEIKSLPKNNPSMTYILWGITQIGQQIKIGDFVYDGISKTIEVGRMNGAVKFILTEENNTKVSHPNMAKVYTHANVY